MTGLGLHRLRQNPLAILWRVSVRLEIISILAYTIVHSACETDEANVQHVESPIALSSISVHTWLYSNGREN